MQCRYWELRPYHKVYSMQIERGAALKKLRGFGPGSDIPDGVGHN